MIWTGLRKDAPNQVNWIEAARQALLKGQTEEQAQIIANLRTRFKPR